MFEVIEKKPEMGDMVRLRDRCPSELYMVLKNDSGVCWVADGMETVEFMDEEALTVVRVHSMQEVGSAALALARYFERRGVPHTVQTPAEPVTSIEQRVEQCEKDIHALVELVRKSVDIIRRHHKATETLLVELENAAV